MENIDTLKHSESGPPRYRLSNANVFVSPCGYHYIDYLDPVEDISPEIDESELTDEEITYIEKSLQSNVERFDNQISILKSLLSIRNKKVLDIGCGGGLFLSKLESEGAKVTGLELSDIRAHYAKTKHNLEIIKRPIESDFWKERYSSTFDVVTLWDVIEHVNYPLSTLRSSSYVLKSGGFLFIDTPCRDSFYHRVGEITYRLSNGRFPTFLNAMYSAHKFGHKQIFSTCEIKSLFEEANLEVIELKSFMNFHFHTVFISRRYLSQILW